MVKLLSVLLLCVGLLSSCAGYRLGGQKPAELSSVTSLYVPLFGNNTQEQRLAPLFTNSMVDAITRDGAYKIASEENADATFVATIKRIDYSVRRTSRFDTLRASDLNVNIEVDWRVVDSQNRVLRSGIVIGTSYFTVTANQQLSRESSFPDVAADATSQITQLLSNGF